jgi:SAM-dependent methyltransferase
MVKAQQKVPTPAPGKPADAGDFLLQRRYRLVVPWIPETVRTMLDFGCGNGAQTLMFTPHLDKVYGLDISESFLDDFRVQANALSVADKVEAMHYDGRNIPANDGFFDLLTSFEVLEHVPDETQALSEMYRVLSPGGRLIISVPNRWWIFETHGADLPLLPWNRVPFFSWLPKSIHDRYARARIYSRSEIVRKIEDRGFDIEATQYITAPMDVVKVGWIQDSLRNTVFKGDRTRVPFLSTAVLVIARK